MWRGLNSFGVVLSGEELSPNDEKIGMPRSVVAFSILFTKNLKEAVSASVIKNRASSYNNIIISPEGVVSVEGSATDYEMLKPNRGIFVHSNHFTGQKMLKYEFSDENDFHNISSKSRSASGKRQAESLIRPNFEVGIEDVKRIMRSHEYGESGNSICSHGERICTVFSFIYKYGNSYFEAVTGNPCQNSYDRINI